MKLPIQITTRDIPNSHVLKDHIYAKAQKLDRFYNRIMACRVVIEAPQKHQHQGKLYNLRIDITVPQEEIVVTRNRNEDIYVALRDAFDDAKRQLEGYSEKQQGNGKIHCYKLPLSGHVVRLFPYAGYGFIEAPDGHEVYFHECSVLKPNFQHLKVGDEVNFVEEMGTKGPQACRVRIRYHWGVHHH